LLPSGTTHREVDFRTTEDLEGLGVGSERAREISSLLTSFSGADPPRRTHARDEGEKHV
jgi:hypothetical protein